MIRITTLLFLITFSVSNLFGQTFFSENFENGFGDWTQYDLDGDGKGWEIYDFSSVIPNYGSGTLITFSRDLIGNEFEPHHLIVSPLIDLSNANPDTLVLRYEAISDYEAGENYQVFITSTNNPDEILASTPIITETSEPEFAKEIDFTAYKGKKVYLSFRHYDSKATGYLGIDNIEIKNPLENQADISDLVYSSYLSPNQEEACYVFPKNNGSNDITSLKITWSTGDESYSEVFTTEIKPYMSAELIHPKPFKFENVGKNIVTMTIEEVNGVPNTSSEKTKVFPIWTISKSGEKMVLVEKSTGTWCGFCPRGFVALEELDKNADDFAAAVAVHLLDTMTVQEYSEKSNFAGAPAMHLDRVVRNVNVDNENIVSIIKTYSQSPCAADMEMTGELVGNNLKLDLSSTFYTNYDKNELRYAVILYENGVTGTGDAFAQANYYSGQNVEMAGFEDKPNPVPAEDMVYDHVGRVLIGGYEGQEGSIPTAITDNQKTEYTFNYSFPEGSKIENFVAIGIVIDATGEVVNARKVKLKTLTSVKPTAAYIDDFKVFPNPASEYINITDVKAGKYMVQIFDMAGRVVQTKSLQIASQKEEVQLDIKSLDTGNYILSLVSTKYSMSKMINKK